MRIIFDPSTVHQSKKGAITGVVYFEFGSDRQFPCTGWNDFVVVLANWWKAAFQEIIEGQAEVDFRFMDGPFWITAVSQRTNLLLLRCVEDRREADGVCETTVQVDVLERELRVFARDVSVACKRAGIKSTDLDALRSQLPN